MASLHYKSYFKHITISACALSIMCAPMNAQPIEKFAVGFGDVNFAIQIEKIGEKLLKAARKGDLKKSISYLFDIKDQVEIYTHTYINFNQQFENVRQYITEQKIKVSKGDWSRIRDYMNSARKGVLERQQYIADHIDGIDYDVEHICEKAPKVNEQDLPVKVTIGVTIALCGLFMLFIPIPICQAYAWRVIGAGCAYAADGAMQRMSDNKKKWICYE